MLNLYINNLIIVLAGIFLIIFFYGLINKARKLRMAKKNENYKLLITAVEKNTPHRMTNTALMGGSKEGRGKRCCP